MDRKGLPLRMLVFQSPILTVTVGSFSTSYFDNVINDEAEYFDCSHAHALAHAHKRANRNVFLIGNLIVHTT